MSLLRHGEGGNGATEIYEPSRSSGSLLQFGEISLDPFAGEEHKIGIGDLLHICRGRFKLVGIDSHPDDRFNADMRATDIKCEIGGDRREGGNGEIGSSRYASERGDAQREY